MFLLHGQESLTILQWAIRGLVGYLFLVFAAKILGQRSISQLRLLDFATALLLGNIMAHPLSDEKIGLIGSAITTTTIVLVHTVGIALTLKSKIIRRCFDSAPITVVKNGQIIEKGLTKAGLTIETLLSEFRKKKVSDVQQVAVALWEPGGALSVFLESQFQPVTASDMLITTKPFSLPQIVIKEGLIKHQSLQELQKDELWLIDSIKKQNFELSQILLATLDSNGNLNLIPRSTTNTFVFDAK